MEDIKDTQPNEQQPVERPSTQSDQTNYKELYIRLNADLQNFKRRVEKEKGEWTTVAQSYVLIPLLPIFEDFDRALSINERQNSPLDATIEGFTLIQKNIKKALADLDVTEIDASGKFDPEYHDALTYVESSDHQSGDIVQVFSKGYLFKGKVIKHTKVSVSK